MRLWHYKLIPVLPRKQLISQWRECIAIKRQWEKGTLKHPLVSYVMNYPRSYFSFYLEYLTQELEHRNISFNSRLYEELLDFIMQDNSWKFKIYPEHNNRYLKQCYYNLQEKYDRGMITQEEWEDIEDLYYALGGE